MAKTPLANLADTSPGLPFGVSGLAVLLGIGLIGAVVIINASVRSPRNEKEYQLLTRPMVADMIELLKREHNEDIKQAVIKEYRLDTPHPIYGKYILLAAYPKEGSRYVIEDSIRGVIYRSPKKPQPGKNPEPNDERKE